MNNSDSLAATLAKQQITQSFPTSAALTDFASACKFIGISRQTGDHWLAQGKFPVGVVRIGSRRIGVPVILLQKWLEQRLLDAGVEHLQPSDSEEHGGEMADISSPAPRRRRGRPSNSERDQAAKSLPQKSFPKTRTS